MVNGIKYDFTLHLTSTTEKNREEGIFYFEYFIGPMPVTSNTKGDITYFYPIQTSSISFHYNINSQCLGLSAKNVENEDEEIKKGKEVIERELRAVDESSEDAYKLEKVEFVLKGEWFGEYMIQMNVLLHGINCYCAKQMEYWLLFKQNTQTPIILFQNQLPFALNYPLNNQSYDSQDCNQQSSYIACALADDCDYRHFYSAQFCHFN